MRDKLNVRINSLERKYREVVEDKKGLEKDNEGISRYFDSPVAAIGKKRWANSVTVVS